MHVYLAGDYRSTALKQWLMSTLQGLEGLTVTDLGCSVAEARATDYGQASGGCDYPQAALALASALEEDPRALGVGICGSGVGICMACNALPGLYAVRGTDAAMVAESRAHNGANVLCLSAYDYDEGDPLAEEDILDMLEAFLTTVPDDVPRHIRAREALRALDKCHH